jgi:ribosomal protein S18
MKKLFAILAAAFVVVACGGGASDKDEPATFEDQLVEYIEDMEEAVEDDDPEAALEALQSYVDWSQSIESTDEVNEVAMKYQTRITNAIRECTALGYEMADDYYDDYDYYY